jgi:hypothetical protein
MSSSVAGQPADLAGGKARGIKAFLAHGFYMACAIGKVSPDLALGRVWIYLAALLIGVILLVIFPWLSIGFL